MATDTTIEERLTKVERALSELQQQMSNRPVDPNWLHRMIGCIDDPSFEDVVKYGREFRQSDRPAEDES